MGLLGGWICTSHDAGNPIASAICTKAKETFRLP
jgi:hypothetical protein